MFGRTSSKERDAETGLDYFGARYNSSAQGRFTSPDSHMGVPGNPQSWNKYAYTFNNPLKLVDPDGHFPTPAHIQWGASALADLGFRNPQGLSRAVNEHTDAHFFENAIHAMSGAEAYQGARWGLLSIAANGLDPVKADVALVMGFHLVQDREAHQGMSGLFAMLEHAWKYHGLNAAAWDADPTSPAGTAAEAATRKFANDFMAKLIANLGEAEAQAFLDQMRDATFSVSDLEKNVQGIVRDLARPAFDNRQLGPAPPTPGGTHYEEDAQRQCAHGNPAACGIP